MRDAQFNHKLTEYTVHRPWTSDAETERRRTYTYLRLHPRCALVSPFLLSTDAFPFANAIPASITFMSYEICATVH